MPPRKGSPVHRLVDSAHDIPAALASIDEPVVGVDVERTAAPRYFKPAALVQVGTAANAVLVDTHVLGPRADIGEFLAHRRVVLHAGTNDIESLDGADMVLDEVDDTSIAASLLGLPTGLDPLLQELLDIALSPDKDKYQRANWEQRPLPDEMAAYAAGDVTHLPALMDELRRQLDAAGRLDWYRQECAHMLAEARSATRAWDDTKGVGRLTPDQRAIMQAVWQCREELARDDDTAPQTVMRDAALIDVATTAPDDVADLQRRNRRRNKPDDRQAQALFDAVQAGMSAAPVPRPERETSSVGTKVDRERHAALRSARAELADDLGIDSGVLCPSRVLWPAVHAEPTSPDELVQHLDLRSWQCDLLRLPLWEAWLEVEVPDDDGD